MIRDFLSQANRYSAKFVHVDAVGLAALVVVADLDVKFAEVASGFTTGDGTSDHVVTAHIEVLSRVEDSLLPVGCLVVRGCAQGDASLKAAEVTVKPGDNAVNLVIMVHFELIFDVEFHITWLHCAQVDLQNFTGRTND